MRHLELKIAFSDYWHCGSGRGGTGSVDAAAVRDSTDGLPVVPGRHIKGLLRHGLLDLSELGHIPPEAATILCGRGTGDQTSFDAKTRFETEPGLLRVGTARLPETWREALGGDDKPRGECELLFRVQNITAISGGTAKRRCLRSIEVTIPVTLRAQLSGDLSDQHVSWLDLATKLLRRVGANRTRGLGRADLSLSEVTS